MELEAAWETGHRKDSAVSCVGGDGQETWIWNQQELGSVATMACGKLLLYFRLCIPGTFKEKYFKGEIL